MTEFLVELYVPRGESDAAAGAARRARRAALEISRQGARVSFVRSIFVPDDETCFHLFEADTADAVREVASRAELVYERIAEARGSETTSSCG